MNNWVKPDTPFEHDTSCFFMFRGPESATWCCSGTSKADGSRVFDSAVPEGYCLEGLTACE